MGQIRNDLQLLQLLLLVVEIRAHDMQVPVDSAQPKP